MDEKSFQIIANYIERLSGIHVELGKIDFLVDRLKPILTTFGFSDFTKLAERLKTSPTADLRREILSAVSTNETFFFRDKPVFEGIAKEIIPRIKNLSPQMRVLSAAASSGQEIYSLAMLFHEQNQTNVHFTGIDVSEKILQKAIKGEYNSHEMSRGITDHQKSFNFEYQNGVYTVKEHLRKQIEFKTYNLLDPLIGMPPFSLILCRYVLIYFKPEVKRQVVEQLANLLLPGGVLIIGASESLLGITDKLQKQSIDPYGDFYIKK